MVRKSLEISLLSILTAVPTALGYVLGPLTHSINRLLAVVSIPDAPLPGVPGTLHLGFTPLVAAAILARAYLGRGGAVKESILLALTGVFFHPGEPPAIRVPKDILLGVGVELSLLRAKKISMGDLLAASLVGGLLSYIPYLLFTPLKLYLLPVFYASLLVLMSGYLISSIIGGYLAALILRRIPRVESLRIQGRTRLRRPPQV